MFKSKFNVDGFDMIGANWVVLHYFNIARLWLGSWHKLKELLSINSFQILFLNKNIFKFEKFIFLYSVIALVSYFPNSNLNRRFCRIKWGKGLIRTKVTNIIQSMIALLLLLQGYIFGNFYPLITNDSLHAL